MRYCEASKPFLWRCSEVAGLVSARITCDIKVAGRLS